MLLYLHGGLVDDKAGRETAVRLAGPAPSGWGLPADWLQLYVVWRTGVFETIATNWLDLARDDRLYKVVLEKLMWFVARKLGVPGQVGRSAAAAAGLTEEETAKAFVAREIAVHPSQRWMSKLSYQSAGGEVQLFPFKATAISPWSSRTSSARIASSMRPLRISMP